MKVLPPWKGGALVQTTEARLHEGLLRFIAKGAAMKVELAKYDAHVSRPS